MKATPLIVGLVVGLGVVGLAVSCAGDPGERAAPEIFDLEAGTSVGLDPAPAAEGVVIPAAELESLLGELLGEHAELVARVMVAAADGDDTADAVDALQANTVELTGAMNTVYGPTGRRDRAYAKLHDYHIDFASFADTATGGTAPAEVVVGLLHTHVEDLTRFIDAHTAGDDAAAEEHLRSAMDYMPVIADALAGAIAAQDPQRFPG